MRTWPGGPFYSTRLARSPISTPKVVRRADSSSSMRRRRPPSTRPSGKFVSGHSRATSSPPPCLTGPTCGRGSSRSCHRWKQIPTPRAAYWTRSPSDSWCWTSSSTQESASDMPRLRWKATRKPGDGSIRRVMDEPGCTSAGAEASPLALSPTLRLALVDGHSALRTTIDFLPPGGEGSEHSRERPAHHARDLDGGCVQHDVSNRHRIEQRLGLHRI